MYIEPNKERLYKLRGISESDIGQQILFCPECDWQLSPGGVCKNMCPECGSKLHVSMIDKELIELVNDDMSRTG